MINDAYFHQWLEWLLDPNRDNDEDGIDNLPEIIKEELRSQHDYNARRI